MQQSQTTLEGDYPQENRMESEGNGGVCSISCGETERKDGVYNLIDKIVSHDNLNRAYKRVKSNKGSAGIDEMEVEQLLGHLVMNKKSIISQIRDGSYEPKPVKRVLIDKEDGSKGN